MYIFYNLLIIQVRNFIESGNGKNIKGTQITEMELVAHYTEMKNKVYIISRFVRIVRGRRKEYSYT